jgi:hypothetical protein
MTRRCQIRLILLLSLLDRRPKQRPNHFRSRILQGLVCKPVAFFSGQKRQGARQKNANAGLHLHRGEEWGITLMTSGHATGLGESYQTMSQLFRYSLMVKTSGALQALIIWKHLAMGTSRSSKIDCAKV